VHHFRYTLYTKEILFSLLTCVIFFQTMFKVRSIDIDTRYRFISRNLEISSLTQQASVKCTSVEGGWTSRVRMSRRNFPDCTRPNRRGRAMRVIVRDSCHHDSLHLRFRRLYNVRERKRLCICQKVWSQILYIFVSLSLSLSFSKLIHLY